ncbi:MULTISPECIES: DUF2799 domain-containing protein [Brenneria]|uniref:DUF2799 domain-containing protein n=1 Tax=Brenneria nigrifluens DSM 30175 = ATCC 13028 TaxID=1121120 RepID=A0A2U1UCJ9_9GAMM|nr:MULTISPECIES: DUF2799 domain-containing protein [Brenneria]EHD20453.1 hypothetical protein BrE312_1022 [Brenneria sp. EniD312]PWC19337.1 DUF2799 domain-containing protein [Brenneria nigrifluens DSM 30175 = ATCC 13028]QCR03653.1 DUF2799 domain-containing protein [Brenneria nigrifluens DSM 30175 = ATCC 13028]
MKYSYCLAVILFIAGCQHNASAPTADNQNTFWYEAGYQDAISGLVVKDNSVLEEWFGNPQIDREAYLRGYGAGQADFCRIDNMPAWGKSGKNFPASCDGVADAEQLRVQWQRSMNQP